jgi:dipeptidase
MVSHLTSEASIHYLTGTSAPCTGVFKPAWTDIALPDIGPEPTHQYDPDSLWWKHEKLHRATLKNYAKRIALYAGDRDQLENAFIDEAFACRNASNEERAALMQRASSQAAEAEEKWLHRVTETDTGHDMGLLYRAAWRIHNRRAGMPEI